MYDELPKLILMDGENISTAQLFLDECNFKKNIHMYEIDPEEYGFCRNSWGEDQEFDITYSVVYIKEPTDEEIIKLLRKEFSRKMYTIKVWTE